MPLHLQHVSKPSAVAQAAAKQVFVSYAHEDRAEVSEFMQQLHPLVQSAGLEVFFDDAALRAGDLWSPRIEAALDRCELFLLFVSPACLASTYCIKAELLAALNRHARQQCRIVPIILKPCMWEILPLPNGTQQTLGSFQAEPTGAQAVTLRTGSERGAVWVQIVRAVAAFTGHAAAPAAGPVLPDIARAAAGRPVPALLPYLCDEQPADHDVRTSIGLWTDSPLVLVLRADEDDCPDKFVERIVELYLGKRLARLAPGFGLKVQHGLSWPTPALSLRKARDVEAYFLGQLIERVVGDPYAGVDDLVRRLQDDRAHLVFSIGLPRVPESFIVDSVHALMAAVRALAPRLGDTRLAFLLWTVDATLKQVDARRDWKLQRGKGGLAESPAPLARFGFDEIRDWTQRPEVRGFATLDHDLLRQTFEGRPEPISMSDFARLITPVLARLA